MLPSNKCKWLQLVDKNKLYIALNILIQTVRYINYSITDK